jgi:hypothetical protein
MTSFGVPDESAEGLDEVVEAAPPDVAVDV